jgi:hypothetical protein
MSETDDRRKLVADDSAACSPVSVHLHAPRSGLYSEVIIEADLMRAHNTRFVVLDSWRGVCALLVAVHNLNFGPRVPQATFVAHSWLFVDFFFVLSGFVITHAYLDKLGSVADVASFVLRRVGRLWPLQVTILIALIGMWLVKPIIAHLFHLPVGAASNEFEHSLRSFFWSNHSMFQVGGPGILQAGASAWNCGPISCSPYCAMGRSVASIRAGGRPYHKCVYQEGRVASLLASPTPASPTPRYSPV